MKELSECRSGETEKVGVIVVLVDINSIIFVHLCTRLHRKTKKFVALPRCTYSWRQSIFDSHCEN